MKKLLIIISIFLLVGCTENTENNSDQIIKEIRDSRVDKKDLTEF